MFKNGDLIFLANMETSHACELIVEVNTFEGNIVTSKNFMTIHKMNNPQTNETSYQGLPDSGLLSNRSVLSNAPLGDAVFNLDNFDIYGLVTNNEIKEQFKKNTSNIIQPTKEAKKAILA